MRKLPDTAPANAPAGLAYPGIRTMAPGGIICPPGKYVYPSPAADPLPLQLGACCCCVCNTCMPPPTPCYWVDACATGLVTANIGGRPAGGCGMPVLMVGASERDSRVRVPLRVEVP